MIIDKNDGMVATVRMTSEEAIALLIALQKAPCAVQRVITHNCPNVSTEHVETVLRRISHGKT